MSTNKNQVIATEVLQAVGGKDNIMQVTHCMTRLRFNLKDESIPNVEEIKKIKGVMGVVNSAGQLQVIIGQNVDQVYVDLCKEAGITATSVIKENLDKPKDKLTVKSVFSNVLNALSGCITPAIPAMTVAAMFKMLVAVFGPSMLGVVTEGSDLYILLTFVGDVGFYFFPVILGYTSAVKFGVTPVLGIFLGGVMLHPTFVELVASGSSFSVYGIPIIMQSYASTLFPIVMSVWVMSYVEKFFKRVLPSMLKTVVAPTLTIAIMLPIALGLLGPAGAFLGQYISAGLIALGNMSGFLGIALIAATWQFLVMTGMHPVMITSMVVVMMSTGSEGLVNPGATIASITVSGMAIGAFLRLKDKDEKSMAFGYFIAGIIGGVTEPALYGLGMKFKRPFIGLVAGGFLGGLYAGIMGVKTYALIPVANFLCLPAFAGGSTANLVNGLIACGTGFISAAVITYLYGFDKDEPAIQKQK